MATPNPQQHADALKLLAFYEIARLANLTEHPDLIQLPAFQKAKALFEARSEYFREGFGKMEAIDDYFKLRLEGALSSQNKSWEDVWAEFAPVSLKRFPLAPGKPLTFYNSSVSPVTNPSPNLEAMAIHGLPYSSVRSIRN